MTRRDNSFLLACIALYDYLNQNAAIVNALPNGQTNTAQLLSIINQLKAELEVQKMSKAGYVTSKNDVKARLLLEARDSIRKLITFAKFTKNFILLEEIKKAKKEIGGSTKVDFLGFAQLVYDRGQSNLAALPTYGINATTQAAMLSDINAFSALLGKTGNGRTEKTQSTKRLRTLFAFLRATVTALSDAVETIRTSKVDFYNGFIAVKRPVVVGNTKQMLRGIVVDMDGKPIEGVAIELLALDEEGNALTGKANTILTESKAKGGFNLKNKPEGTYRTTFKKPDFEDQQRDLILVKGERLNLKVVMKKIVK